MRFKGSQNIKVKCESIRDTIKVYGWLEKNYKLEGGEWDIFEGEPTVIRGSEQVTGDYEPEVRYTWNGDGNPKMIELDEGVDEEWLTDEIEAGTGIKVRVDCEIEMNEGDAE